jgi:hypothetical protein
MGEGPREQSGSGSRKSFDAHTLSRLRKSAEQLRELRLPRQSLNQLRVHYVSCAATGAARVVPVAAAITSAINNNNTAIRIGRHIS